MDKPANNPSLATFAIWAVAVSCLFALTFLVINVSGISSQQPTTSQVAHPTIPITVAPTTTTPTMPKAMQVTPAASGPVPLATTANPSAVIVMTGDEQQYQQLKVADTLVTLYMPESIKHEPTTQLIIALADQPSSQSFKDLTLYAEQQHSILIAPVLDYGQKDNQVLAEKITNLVIQLQPLIHTKIKKQLEFYGINQGIDLAQAYARLYPQYTLGLIKPAGGTFVLSQTATKIADPQVAFGDGQ